MLHLAQVIKNSISGKLELQLLAFQKSDSQWAFCDNKYLSLKEEIVLKEGILILVELDKNNEIVRFRDAKDWVLNLIRQYLTKDNLDSSLILEEEKERIEHWRQELTSQSQDLTRIRLEIETRREELQQLEKNLNLERENLKSQSE